MRASRKANKHSSFPRTSRPRSIPSVPGLAQARATQVKHSASPSKRLIPIYAIASFMSASTPFRAQFSATKRGALSILSRSGGGPGTHGSPKKNSFSCFLKMRLMARWPPSSLRTGGGSCLFKSRNRSRSSPSCRTWSRNESIDVPSWVHRPRQLWGSFHFSLSFLARSLPSSMC